MNNILLNLTKDSEKCKLNAYQDQGGVWTIGYGATGYGIEKGTVWQQDRAERDVVARLEEAVRAMIKMSPIMAAQNESKQAAIADFIYNCGANAYRNSHLKISIDAGHWQEAASQLMKWDYVNGVVSNGLYSRRTKEAALLVK